MSISKNAFLFTLGAALLGPAALHAQKTPKEWAKALETLAQKANNAPRMLPKPISLEEATLLENRFLALDALNRTLKRNPNLPHAPEFAGYLQTLRLLDVGLPQPPAADASAAQKAQYASRLQEIIAARAAEEKNALAGYVFIQTPEPKANAAARVNWPRRRKEMTLANGAGSAKWEAFRQAKEDGTERFAWGTAGWDEIRLGPVKFPSDPKDPFYGCRKGARKIVRALPGDLTGALDLITFNPALTPRQKTALLLHVAQLSDLLGYQAVYAYMQVFGALPAASAPGLAPSGSSRALSAYARNTQIILIEKLKRGEAWTDEQADAFIDLAAFLPGHNGRDVLAALSYLEPKAALYLLTHPEETQVTQNIRREIQTARAQLPPSWQPDAPLFKAELKQKTGMFGSHRHMTALAAYHDLLVNRMEAVQHRLYVRRYWLEHIYKPNKDSKEQLAYKLFTELDMRRLQNLYDQLLTRQREVQIELTGLYRVTPH